ncbi:hypothetical protein BDY24DRAFT_402246 [Mrakia frigida]|uniref:uncharacterized protein n=1 Tax=Mrakia frigida TaxID=29902 RepID=UPI003FCC14DC
MPTPTLSSLLPPNGITLPALPAAPSSLAFLGGPLPASSPLHLVLSSLSSNNPKAQDRALILTQDLQTWTSYLLSDGKGRDGDAWLREEAGRGREVGRLGRVDVRICPSAAHMGCLLANLRTSEEGEGGGANELERNPTMLVLLEPSSFYVERVEGGKKVVVDSDEEDEPMEGHEEREEQEQEEGEVRWRVRDGVTSSNYGSLIALALSAVDHLNATRQEGYPPTQLVIIDTLASQLSFPILPPPPSKLTSSSRKRSLGDDYEKHPPISPGSKKKEGPSLPLMVLLRSMIDWVAIATKSASLSSSLLSPRLESRLICYAHLRDTAIGPTVDPSDEIEDLSLPPSNPPPTHSIAYPPSSNAVGAEGGTVWFREEMVDSLRREYQGARGKWVWCGEDGSDLP